MSTQVISRQASPRATSAGGLGRTRPARSARVVESAADLPTRLYRHMFREMAQRLSGSAPARRCAGMSFAFCLTDRGGLSVCYQVGPGGTVRLGAGAASPATFTFAGASCDFDAVLIGALNPIPLLLTRRIGLRGSFLKLRSLLVLLPALQSAYVQCRAALRMQYASEFEFRF